VDAKFLMLTIAAIADDAEAPEAGAHRGIATLFVELAMLHWNRGDRTRMRYQGEDDNLVSLSSINHIKQYTNNGDNTNNMS
jgi:hypothetical protein